MYRIIIIIACSLCWMTAATAQEVKAAKHISTADGLSNDFVVRLAIDDDGYVWAATEAGVNRIAGSRSTVFKTSDDGKKEQCTALYYHHPSQQMLIATEGGRLNIYDCRKAEMSRMTKDDGLEGHNIRDIASATDGCVWLVYGNGRIQKLNPTTRQSEYLELSELHDNRCALDNRDGWLYIGHSQHGMTMVDINGNGIRRFVHEPGNPASLPGNNVRRIIMDSNRHIWVGTDQGLARFHPKTGTFEKVRDQQADYGDNVYDICEMRDGSIWVALDLGGVKIARGLYYDEVPVRLSSLNARSVVCDEFGNAWVANHSTGIDVVSAEKSLFHVLDYKSPTDHTMHVNALCSDSEGFLWTGSEDELAKWQDNQLFGRWTTQGSTSREHNYIRTLMADSRGNIWMGFDDQGVFRLDRQSGLLSQVHTGHDGCDVHSFAEDANGSIWIGSEMGVYRCDEGRAVLQQEQIETLTKGSPVTSFFWTDNGRMIISTIGSGLHVVGGPTLDTSNGLPSDHINQVIKDDDIGLWLATYEGLVHIKDAQQMEGITSYDQRQGLADSHIQALTTDGAGRIWMSTYAGISCFDPKTKRFYNYDLFDNRHLSGFAAGAVAKDYAGRIYFASAQGVCYFDPDDFDDNARVSQVQIVSCDAYNPVGSDTEILTLIPNESNVVRASHHQNTLRLLFTVRNAAQNGREEYAYMMEGLSDNWYYIGSDQEVVFRGLAPGEYTFRLKAKLKEQEWDSATETEITIVVSPPWWRTWLFCIFYVALIGFGGWYAYNNYTIQRKQNN